MFILYAIVAGLVGGILLHGRLQGLAAIRIHWAALAFASFGLQIGLLSEPVSTAIGDLGAPIYVASSALVLAVVLRNVPIPGLAIVAIGATSNLAAIVANGGWMPASPSALAAVGESIGQGYSNSRVFDSPALAPLTDVMALPRWLPFANIFSIGDVVIGIGIAVAIVVAMRRSEPAGVTVIGAADGRSTGTSPS